MELYIIINPFKLIIMKLEQLTKEELINTNGGSEASDGLCYLFGVACKGIWNGIRAYADAVKDLGGSPAY
jgi:hypothetical protein